VSRTKWISLFLETLDAALTYIGADFFIAYGTQGRHKSDLHAEGLAVDIGISCKKGDKLKVLLDVLRFPFMGVGVYPKGVYSMLKNSLALHLDFRLGTRKAYWIGIPKMFNGKKGKNEYFGLTGDNLRKYGVI